MTIKKSFKGLFVGLITLDLIYLAESPPQNNQKLVADDYTVASGGPVTNAAVSFSHLGNNAKILGVVGCHPMTQLIKSDLANYKIEIVDLNYTTENPPPVSSIIVSKTGKRAVISINAVKTQANIQAISSDILQDIDIVLIDGHQMEVGCAIAQLAQAKNIPVVIDGGSWKPGFDKLLPFVNYAICSANFYPPNCQTSAEVFAYLNQIGIPHIAITHGENPIQYLSQNEIKLLNVPKIQAADTLGAGDIFHGAFCNHVLQETFTTALEQSAKVAALSCQFFGTRRWMEEVKS
ncbi:sugar kinase [Rivularia sp. UHCC 0363]|uniref:sugar kinase n=1 Tax=Rivularia sp. UHCC 0363 TaxID=3110244 RepID=UPI002B20132B|nr:sugar kinase [Rivularia sp. UHCC 0363]MEA5593776.1 sugar kinase [Rivularia sp. UHCC 0363]